MTHPVLAAVASIEEALKTVADVNPTFMTTTEKAAALRELVRTESRVAELRLRILADADAGDVAETTAAHTSAEWLATQTHLRHEDARADLALAVAVDRRWSVLGGALRAGDATLAQAQVIARALAALPGDVPADILASAEETLVGHAADFGPRPLARLGARILDVIAPEIAEAAEARRLADLEAHAQPRTRLSLRRRGDGTTRLAAIVPDATADRLAAYLQAHTNPRKSQRPQDGDPVERLSYPRRLGQAFCQLLEALDPTRLPIHGGDATTLIVTIDLEDLRKELATADLLGTGHVPGADQPSRITAAQARRLACTAQLIPAVLGADSEVLDLGRTRRLFSPAQRKALLLRDVTCREEGCDIPGTWCEAHHRLPWTHGGTTDLDNAQLLCNRHHHTAHDHRYQTERLPNGDVRFTRRQ
ncbi:MULTISPECIES: HNH endonuclease signature motif containing protein [unclassified Nocardioides]|uniref:HNH endonuclease signature motif containing protein n=1 Tax=unclassified Nocardioides TaxID=2615069 RepID=UPI003619425E